MTPAGMKRERKKSDSNGKNRAEEERNAWLIHSECSKVPEVHYNVTIIITFHQIAFLSRGCWNIPKTCAVTQFPFYTRRRLNADEQHLHRWKIHTLLVLLVNFKCKSMIFRKSCNIEKKMLWCYGNLFLYLCEKSSINYTIDNNYITLIILIVVYII